MPKDTIHSTTQQFLDIFDITNDLVIMKDGTTSLILSIDAMNFGLLAEEEQDSIMYAYAGLLNSLNYSIQILIRSQTKDVTGYLKLLKDREDKVVNRSKQKRIQKYREFVGNLIRERNVLDKKFFVVIPAQPVELGILPPSSLLPGKGNTDITSVDRNLILEKARNILEPKRDHLIAQFARIGLYSRQLETQEIIQLFYLNYNPSAFEGQQISDSRSYTAPMVSAQVEKNLMNESSIPTPMPPELNPILNKSEKVTNLPEQTVVSPELSSTLPKPGTITPEPTPSQSVVKPPAMQQSTEQQFITQPPIAQPPTINPPSVQPTTIQPPIMQPTEDALPPLPEIK